MKHFDHGLSDSGGVDDEGAVVVLDGPGEFGADLFDDIDILCAERDAGKLADGVARVFEFLVHVVGDRVAIGDEGSRIFDDGEGGVVFALAEVESEVEVLELGGHVSSQGV